MYVYLNSSCKQQRQYDFKISCVNTPFTTLFLDRDGKTGANRFDDENKRGKNLLKLKIKIGDVSSASSFLAF
jgi:hypothetical protein